MFKLILTLFVMTNGVPADHPFSTGYVKVKFPTKEACMKYLATEEGKETKKELDDAANEKEGDVAIKINCVKIDEKPSGDGKI